MAIHPKDRNTPITSGKAPFYFLCIAGLLFASGNSSAASFSSIATGNWTAPATWTITSGTDSDTIPDSDDEVTIEAGNTVTMNGNPGSCYSLTIKGTIQWTTSNRTTDVGSGGLLMSGGSITGNRNGYLNVTGDFTVESGINNLGRCNFTVLGNTVVNGELRISSRNGTKTFSNVTVNSSGYWNTTTNESFIFTGNLIQNGSFTSNTGNYHFSGTGLELGGTSGMAITSFSITGATINTTTVTVSQWLRGVGSFSQGSSGALNLELPSGNFTLTTFNASAPGNSVNYGRTNTQNIRQPNDGSYHHLGILGSGVKSLLGNTTIAGNLTISSSLDVTNNNYNILLGGNWMNTGSFNRRSGTVILNGGGNQTLTKATGETFYNLEVSGSGTKYLGSNLTVMNNLIINSVLDVSPSNYALSIQKNWINNGIFSSGSGDVTFNGTTAQSIGGNAVTDFYNLIISNTSGVSLSGNQNLKGTLSLGSGTFTTTGYVFTLVSTATETGRIGPITGGDINGNITMQRYLPPGQTGWRFLGSCVSGGTLSDWLDDFAMSGFPGSTSPGSSFTSVYTYNETTTGAFSNGYTAPTDISNAIIPGKGYWAYIGPVPLTVDVSGAPAKLNQGLTVSFTSGAGPADDGWNLVSNPYPSQVDWNSASWSKSNLDDAIYIWNPQLQQYASYVNGVGTHGASNIIPSSQAFWVKANAVSPALSMTENVKSSGTQPFIRMAGKDNSAHWMRFEISGNNYRDETMIRFDESSTLNFDAQKDAYKLYSNNSQVPSLATVAGIKDLSINSLSPLTSSIEIPLKVTVKVSGNYLLKWDDLTSMPASSCVRLKDLLTGTVTDLRSVNSYGFFISDTTSAPRFILMASPGLEKETQPVTCNGEKNGLLIAKGSGSGPWDYEWKDQQGTILKKTTGSSFPDTLSNLSGGIYRVTITDPSSACGSYSDSMTVVEPDSLKINLAIRAISCYLANDGKLEVLIAGGTPLYAILWSGGNTGSAITGLSPGTYSVTIADKNGCNATSSATISQPQVLLSAFNVSEDTLYISGNTYVSFSNLSQGADRYEWFFDDSSSVNTNIQPEEHNFEDAGTYKVSLKVYQGNCTDSSFRTITVINDTIFSGIENPGESPSFSFRKTGMEFYLVYHLPGEESSIVTMYNTAGQKLSADIILKGESGHVLLPLPEEHTSQVYFIRIETGKRRIVKKLVH